MKDRPLHRLRRSFPRRGTQRVSGIEAFIPCMFRQSASFVPCMIDELTRPLCGYPSSTRKGGDRLSAFRFPHVCLVRIVQDDDLRRPKAAEWSGSPLGELAPKASEGGGMKNGGLHNFFARHRPESRCPESRTTYSLEDS